MRTRVIFLSALLSSAIILSSAAASDQPASDTVQRLQAAYNAETNAYERYRAFAARADEEGYTQVATLFRALARSEQILYTNHMDAIRELGSAPQSDPEIPVAESTKENLQTAARKTEPYEHDSSYATYARRAKTAGNPRAAKCFEYVRDVEAANLRLITAAVKNLEQMRGPIRGYYICANSGFTSAALDASRCTGSWELVK